MPDRYPNVVRFVREQPWAIMPEKLAVILDLVRYRNQGFTLTDDEIAERVDEKRSHAAYVVGTDGTLPLVALAAGETMAARTSGRKTSSVIAVLGIYGVITQRADMFSEMSGMTSTQRVSQRLQEALDDRAVGSIALDIDSPGGGVYGVQELADQIRAARGQKPIVAIANSLMASAAYWIGSQAEEIIMSPGAEAGSIGVYAAHEDVSAALEEAGVKVTLLSYGENKTLGNPFEPLSDEARAAIQGRVDDYGAAFDRSVAKGRGVKVEDVRSRFGQGLVFGAKEAVSRGLADRVDTLDGTLSRLARETGKPAGPSAAALAEREAAEIRRRLI